eukprot:6572325-Karenia_brevis.AAC.1
MDHWAAQCPKGKGKGAGAGPSGKGGGKGNGKPGGKKGGKSKSKGKKGLYDFDGGNGYDQWGGYDGS